MPDEAGDPEPPCAGGELFVIGPAGIAHKVKDPVCGAVVDQRSAVMRESKDGSRCYFCSKSCLVLYYLDPRRYLAGRG